MTKTVQRILTFLMCLCLMLSAAAFCPTKACAEEELHKVICETSATPVVLMNASDIYCTVYSGTQQHYSMASWTWFDADGNVETGQFKNCTYRVEICVEANEGYYFGDYITGLLNNSECDVSVRDWDGDGANDHVVLTRYYTPQIWGPTITKQPISESTDPGGYVSFNAAADKYSTGCYWILESADGNTTIKVDDTEALNQEFPDLTVTYTGNGNQTLTLHNCQTNLNGWYVRCIFQGVAGEVPSQKALIVVNLPALPTATPTPSPTPTPTATPTPSPSASESPAAAASPSPTPAAAAAASPTPTPAAAAQDSGAVSSALKTVLPVVFAVAVVLALAAFVYTGILAVKKDTHKKRRRRR